MDRIKRRIYRFRLFLLFLDNKVRCLFLRSSSRQLYIVSSLKYVNKLKEDLCLQRCFLKNKIFCKIIAFEDNVFSKKCLIKSTWGYHKNLDRFVRFVFMNETINSSDIIINNMDKRKQYELLERYNISRIDTIFLENTSMLKNKNYKQVVKPVIGESGDNTFIVDKNFDIKQVKKLDDVMVQPYVEGIKDGELSIIVIDNVIKYGIIRYPGVLTSYKREKFVPREELSEEVLSIFRKVKGIIEYKEAKFMRLDLVKYRKGYKVLEIELIDPDLFIETIPDKNFKNEIYQDIVDMVKKEM